MPEALWDKDITQLSPGDSPTILGDSYQHLGDRVIGGGHEKADHGNAIGFLDLGDIGG